MKETLATSSISNINYFMYKKKEYKNIRSVKNIWEIDH